jgi:hypothetical protein
MTSVALMSLDDRVMHLPGDSHGRARCGEVMRDPWQIGPLVVINDRAVEWCEQCLDLAATT